MKRCHHKLAQEDFLSLFLGGEIEWSECVCVCALCEKPFSRSQDVPDRISCFLFKSNSK